MMRLFTLDKNGKLTPYIERDFGESKKEVDLEVILENNPEYFFESSNTLIIGRQVPTDLNKFIDLLGLDRTGNTVTIELKKGKTPREVIAQIFEYASFISNLDYPKMNEIFQKYRGEENNLEEYHRQYFNLEPSEPVSFNKVSKLVIVAQEISPDIKNTALYLRRKGIDIYCIEFKYFQTKMGETIISSDFVVGEYDIIQIPGGSESREIIDERQFLQSLDQNGQTIFTNIFKTAKEQKLIITWGSEGFSLSIPLNEKRIPFIFGYRPSSVYKQSVYADYQKLAKIPEFDEITEYYTNAIDGLDYFKRAGNRMKWMIDRQYSDNEMNQFLSIIKEIVKKVQSIEFSTHDLLPF